jgi:hypothetical protein
VPIWTASASRAIAATNPRASRASCLITGGNPVDDPRHERQCACQGPQRCKKRSVFPGFEPDATIASTPASCKSKLVRRCRGSNRDDPLAGGTHRFLRGGTP